MSDPKPRYPDVEVDLSGEEDRAAVIAAVSGAFEAVNRDADEAVVDRHVIDECVGELMGAGDPAAVAREWVAVV